MTREQLIGEITREVLRALHEEAPSDAGMPVALDDPAEWSGGRDVSREGLVNLCHDLGISRIGGKPGEEPGPELARFIDHTILKPDAARSDIERLCLEARENDFASVCVQPWWVPLCADLLGGTSVKVCTVIGFPHGMNKPETKSYEARRAVADGATELDMVINIGALKSKDLGTVERDIRAVVEGARPRAAVKVILETAYLTDEEKAEGCALAKGAGADYVKTSTGFGPGGATVEDVALMRRVVGEDMGVKAAGGIRDAEIARKMIEAGATRLGASASLAIVHGSAKG